MIKILKAKILQETCHTNWQHRISLDTFLHLKDKIIDYNSCMVWGMVQGMNLTIIFETPVLTFRNTTPLVWKPPPRSSSPQEPFSSLSSTVSSTLFTVSDAVQLVAFLALHLYQQVVTSLDQLFFVNLNALWVTSTPSFVLFPI